MTDAKKPAAKIAAQPSNDFTIEASDEYLEEFVKLDDGYQEKVVRLLNHLKKTPKARYPGMTPLRGEQSGYFEYTISQSNGHRRLFYRVDDEKRIVTLEAIASHPTWTRSRDGMNIRKV